MEEAHLICLPLMWTQTLAWTMRPVLELCTNIIIIYPNPLIHIIYWWKEKLSRPSPLMAPIIQPYLILPSIPRTRIPTPSKLLNFTKMWKSSHSCLLECRRGKLAIIVQFISSHSLPESPPDSGSEPPHSPQDRAVGSPCKSTNILISSCTNLQ